MENQQQIKDTSNAWIRNTNGNKKDPEPEAPPVFPLTDKDMQGHLRKMFGKPGGKMSFKEWNKRDDARKAEEDAQRNKLEALKRNGSQSPR